MTLIERQRPTDDDIRWMMGLDLVEITLVLETMSPVEQEDLLARAEALMPPPEPWEPMAHQVAPPTGEDWKGWLLMGGRGIGKTAAVTHAMNEHAMGPPCLHGRAPHRMGIIAPTFGDASASIVHGDDGLVVINPDIRTGSMNGYTVVRWPNGSYAYIFGVNTLNDVDRLRARGNRCFDVREEIAAWRYLADGMQQANLGLRLGLARWVGATTPRPRPTIRLLNDSEPRIRVSHAETMDNWHLAQSVRDDYYDEYGNTRLGIQELQGLILEDQEGALWTQELIEQYRVAPEDVPKLQWVRTYVDPSWGTTNDECGIIVVGFGVNRHVYVLADLSRRATPNEWGLIAAIGRLPRRNEDGSWVDVSELEPRQWYGRVSQKVVGEGNFQGETVNLVMQGTATSLKRRILFSLCYASKGKALRAGPVHQLFEQGRVHIVGTLKGLEFQMTNWVPPEVGEDAGDPGDPEPAEEGGPESSDWSPDRLDAMVFGVTDALVGKGGGSRVFMADGQLPPSRPSGRIAVAKPDVSRINRNTRQGQMTEEQLKRDS